MALEGTLSTPLGKVPKKTAVIAGGGIVGVLGIAWYRSKNAGASADTSSTSTLDPAVYDQETGQTWESEGLGPYGEDPNGGQFDSSSFTGGQVIGSGGGGSFGGGSAPNTGPGTFTSNGNWSQYATDYLVNTIGRDGPTVSRALGAYLAGSPVTDSQIGIINEATGAAGMPPVTGANGRPPAFNHVGTTTGGIAKNPVDGAHVVSKTTTSVQVDWNASPGAKSYLVTTFQGSKTVNKRTVTAPVSRITVTGLHPGTNYNVRIRAQPGGTGGRDANVSVRTNASTPKVPVRR
jgi:hypothetical protein